MFDSLKIKSRDRYGHIWFFEKLRVRLNVSMQKTQENKFVSVFRIKLIRILISADLVLQPWWVQTFFLRKYLILLHFLILKIPIEDSILCHKPDFIHHFLTRRAFACLLQYSVWEKTGNAMFFIKDFLWIVGLEALFAFYLFLSHIVGKDFLKKRLSGDCFFEI